MQGRHQGGGAGYGGAHPRPNRVRQRPPLYFDQNHPNFSLYNTKITKIFALRAIYSTICYEIAMLSSFYMKIPNFFALRAILYLNLPNFP